LGKPKIFAYLTKQYNELGINDNKNHTPKYPLMCMQDKPPPCTINNTTDARTTTGTMHRHMHTQKTERIYMQAFQHIRYNGTLTYSQIG
jgi:hypothetical protein